MTTDTTAQGDALRAIEIEVAALLRAGDEPWENVDKHPTIKRIRALAALASSPAPLGGAKPLAEWHEDDGPVTWWKFPVDEPAWIGTPTCSDWPGYHTHWTPHPAVPTPPQRPEGQESQP